jgi:pimeloyl-ACP methyl ester carboxylesterase
MAGYRRGMRQRTARTNGVQLKVTEAGPADGPLVILAHGFPEGAYSWRHQMEPLAAAGYRVIAPDQRGYGSSSLPPNVADYGMDQLTSDLIGLVDDVGREQAVFVGHDWGAFIVWDLARLHPERTRAVVGVSVPFTNWPMKPTELFKMLVGDRFFYMVYFQTVGPAEEELEADPYRTMRNTLYGASGDAFDAMMARSAGPQAPAEGSGWFTMMPEAPAELPAWLTEEDLNHYAAEFAHSGFFGPISYYRNLDANFDRMASVPTTNITMPAWFITGDRDFVGVRNKAAIDAMPSLLPGYRGMSVIDGAGHWTQQEKPHEFNEALLGFLKTLD